MKNHKRFNDFILKIGVLLIASGFTCVSYFGVNEAANLEFHIYSSIAMLIGIGLILYSTLG